MTENIRIKFPTNGEPFIVITPDLACQIVLIAMGEAIIADMAWKNNAEQTHAALLRRMGDLESHIHKFDNGRFTGAPLRNRDDDAVPAKALATLSAAFAADPEYAWTWHCNLAMMAVDAGAPYHEAQRGAANLMHRAFGVDTRNNPLYSEAGPPVGKPAGDDAAVEALARMMTGFDAGDSTDKPQRIAHDECYTMSNGMCRRFARQTIDAIRAGRVPGAELGTLREQIKELTGKLAEAEAAGYRLKDMRDAAELDRDATRESERRFRAEVEAGFRKHNLAAGPEAIDGLVRDLAAERERSAEYKEASQQKAGWLLEARAEADALRAELEKVKGRKVKLPAKASIDSLFSEKDRALWGGAIDACAAAIRAAGVEVEG
jgi:hypothetical protein